MILAVTKPGLTSLTALPQSVKVVAINFVKFAFHITNVSPTYQTFWNRENEARVPYDIITHCCIKKL